MAKIIYFSEEELAHHTSPPQPTHNRFKNLLGLSFDDLTVIKYYGKKKREHFWFCRCSCGKVTLKGSYSVTNKRVYQRCFKCTRELKSIKRLPEVLKQINLVHGERYTYNLESYINSKSKIIINCTMHGNFEQSVDSHLSGKGCPTCGALQATMNHRNDLNTFIERSREAHGEKYDYSKVEYNTRRTYVTIVCPSHGEFEQDPANHWSGRGCPVCRYITSASKIRSTTEEFIVKAVKKHGNKYDYSNVKYRGATLPVKITCPLHGEFEQTPSVHCQGFGCNSCSTRGYNTKKGGYFYISSLDNTAIKYGITGKEPKKRMVQHNRESVFNHEVLHSFFFSDGYIPKKIESYVKNNIGKKFVSKEELPDGYTETCCISKLDEILKVVTMFTEENK